MRASIFQGVDFNEEDARFQAYLTANGWRGQIGADGFERDSGSATATTIDTRSEDEKAIEVEEKGRDVEKSEETIV